MPPSSLRVTGPDGAFDAYVAYPAAERAPAVVVIQEIFGVNRTVRSVADRLAAEGFLAVAPDLFWRFEPGIVLDDRKPDDLARAFAYFPKFDVDKGVSDIEATLTAARALPECDGRVGAVGYCLGGLLAYLTATRTDADAVVSYYGVNIDKFTGEAERLAHPLMLHIAGEDKFVPLEAQARILSGLKNHPQIEINVYPGRDHAFAREGGDAYEPGDAALADGRTLAFLRKALG